MWLQNNVEVAHHRHACFAAVNNNSAGGCGSSREPLTAGMMYTPLV